MPTAPATPPHIISRVIANELSESEGRRIIVENKAGAVFLTLGGTEVLKHPADGYASNVDAVRPKDEVREALGRSPDAGDASSCARTSS